MKNTSKNLKKSGLKLFAISLFMILSFSFLVACGNQKKTDKGSDAVEQEDNAAKKTFAVGFDASFPPYGYVDENGDHIGFDLDLAAELCKRNDFELVLKPIAWDSKDKELNAKAIDCIWNGFTINGREDKYAWTAPYVDNSQVIVVKENAGINTLDDLKGKTVAVQDDSSAYKALTDEDNEELIALTESFKELMLIPDYNTAFLNLEAGAVDAVALDVGVAKFQLENRKETFIILDEILVKEEYGVGFALGNEDLRDVVEKTLKEMAADGTFKEIAEKWKLEDSIILK